MWPQIRKKETATRKKETATRARASLVEMIEMTASASLVEIIEMAASVVARRTAVATATPTWRIVARGRRDGL